MLDYCQRNLYEKTSMKVKKKLHCILEHMVIPVAHLSRYRILVNMGNDNINNFRNEFTENFHVILAKQNIIYDILSLAPNGLQNIVWTKDGHTNWSKYGSLGLQDVAMNKNLLFTRTELRYSCYHKLYTNTHIHTCNTHAPILGLFSPSGRTSYSKISWNLEDVRFGFRLFDALWNLRGTSAEALLRCLSNFRVIPSS